MYQGNNSTTSSKRSARPSPGLTLDNLNFKNLPKTLKQRPQQPKEKSNLVKYSKISKDEELQRNLANYELFFEKNIQAPPRKKTSKPSPYAYSNLNKADIYYPKNYRDTNAEVLSKILDSNSEFSPNNPSSLKQCQNEIDKIQKEMISSNEDNEVHEEFNNIPEEEKKIESSEGEDKVDTLNNKKLTINLSYNGDNLSETYLDALAEVMTLLDPVFDSLSLQDKIDKLIALTEDERRPTRLGALVALYIILKKYTSEISEEQKGSIIEKVITLLQSYNQQEEVFLVCCLEICSMYGPIDILIENIGLICMFITDFNFPLLQKATFNCLMCMEYEGIRTLVELASKDYQDYQSYILNNLIQTPHIQRIIIIRSLLNEVYSSDYERRNSALAAINRMHDLVDDPDTLEKLEGFFSEPKIKKDFISSILRTCGPDGELILLNEIKTNKDFSVRVSIANAFSYRVPKVQKYLDVRLDKNDTYSVSNNLPGSFCTYYGNVSPFIENKNYTIELLLDMDDFNDVNDLDNPTEETKQTEEYLEINTRDFLAALQRMLVMNYDHSNPRLVHNGNPNTIDNINFKLSKNEIIEKYINFFDIANIVTSNMNSEENTQNDVNIDETGKYFVSEEIIKALIRSLKDYSTKVREAAATSLGIIGLPEALLSIDGLIENINDEDVNVRSKIIWAIGRVAEGTDNSIIPFIVNSVQSNMWKVKKASLYTLAQLGDRCAKNSLPYLVKLLKESPINKQIIAETLIRLGIEGESVLLKIMSSEPDSNYKLKSAIVRALAFTDITSTNIDFIVECIFKQGKNSFALVRKSAIFAIKVLAEKGEEKITYLKRKNVIPFYYDKLKDKDSSIQRYAITCIKSLGPQGELILIEGFVKDANPIVRANCAIGLGELGVHTIRTLLVGLHDEDDGVRATVEKVIVNMMNIGEVVEYFANEGNQLLSLKIAVKDVLDKKYPLSMFTINYLNQLLEEIEKNSK